MAAAIAVLVLVAAGVAATQIPRRPGESGAAVPEELPGYRIWRIPQSWWGLDRVAVSYAFTDPGNALPHPANQVLVADDLRVVRHSPRAGASGVALSPDGTVLGFFDDSSSWRMVDLTTGDESTVPVAGDPADVSLESLTWSPDGERVFLLVSTRDQPYPVGALWVVEDGAAIPVPEALDVRDAAQAPDGRLAVVREDGSVDLIDLASGAVLDSLLGQSGPDEFAAQINADRPPDIVDRWAERAGVAVRWSPSGRRLVAVERRGAVVESEPYWQGSIVTVVTDGERGDARRLENFPCTPLVMLTESELLCQSRTGKPDDNWPALVTLDVDSGARRVVTYLTGKDTTLFLRVADDLARSWQFSDAEPWVAPELRRW
ncbi:MAG: hypothetical protein Q4G43_09845 [Mobilicoccus sp.]|nr:hypothetical protein [Mobilicoccus sp.]